MFIKRKGIVPLVIVLIVALGLLGGTALGYKFREPIKKAIQGKTTAEEIKDAVNQEINQLQTGKDKFELEGVATNVDTSLKMITVKIKSSTNSIKELRLSETPITLTDLTQIIFGSKEDLKIADIPINSQVHVDGTISDGKLTATKIIIQKEDIDEGKNADKEFKIHGVVKVVNTDNLIVTVSSSNNTLKDHKGLDVTLIVVSSTVMEKDHLAIKLTDIKAGDEIRAEGTIETNDVFTASKIEVKVSEEGQELKENQGNNFNKDKEKKQGNQD